MHRVVDAVARGFDILSGAADGVAAHDRSDRAGNDGDGQALADHVGSPGGWISVAPPMPRGRGGSAGALRAMGAWVGLAHWTSAGRRLRLPPGARFINIFSIRPT